MNILIIGSKGFIGSYCVSFFSKQHNVWECDVSVDYTTTNYIQVDATNANYKEALSKCKFDVCINCSGAASVPNSIVNPERDFNLNTVNVFRLLTAIKDTNTNCKFINLSSAAVYGNPERLPIIENQGLAPISPYGIHKKMAEAICKEFNDIYNIPTCSLRIFSAYGNNLKKQLFWDLHLKSKEKAVNLFGTGKESRDFIHVKDVVNAINCVITNANFNGEILNVANGKEHLISNVVSSFYAFYDKDCEYKFNGNSRPGDPINWVADISKLKALGYKQTVTLDNGLRDYAVWLLESE